MPCVFSKPAVSGAGAAPSMAVCTLEAGRDPVFSAIPHETHRQQTSADGSDARVSVLFPLFRRCCPRRTLKRLFTAGSALVLCSSCNLLTPMLLGVAVDAAAASHLKARTAATSAGTAGFAAGTAAAKKVKDTIVSLSSVGNAASDAAAAVTGAAGLTGEAFAIKSGFLREVWHAVRDFISGGGRAALQRQPPKVLFALVCGVVLLGAAMSWLRTTQLETAEQEMRAEVRRQLFSALLYAPPVLLFSRTNLGLLLPLFREDTDTLVSAFSSTQAQILRYCSSAFGGSTLLLLLSPRLTAVALLLLPLAGCSAMLLAKRQRALQREREEVWEKCNALLADRLLHMRTVYIHQEQEQEAYRFQRQQIHLLTAARRAAFANGLFYGGLSFLVNSTVVALLVLGSRLVASGSMTQGSLTTFAVYSSMVGVGCSGLAAVSGDLSRAAAAGTRINAIFEAAAAATTPRAPAAGRLREVEEEAAAETLADEDKSALGKKKKTTQSEQDEFVEKTKQEIQQQQTATQQQDDDISSAGKPLLQQLLQQHAEGRLTAAQVARRMQGEIRFHNVTYIYRRGDSSADAARASPAAVVDGSVSTRELELVSPGDTTQQQRQQGQQQQKRVPEAAGEAVEGEEEEEGGGVRNINMTIAAGSITALTGASGSGKSTLLKLFTKQLTPQAGRVTLDGVDIQQIPTQILLQQLLGVVSADSIALLSGLSIRENVLYGVWTPQQQQQGEVASLLHKETSQLHATAAAAAHHVSPLHPAVPAAALPASTGCPFLRMKAAARHLILSHFLSHPAAPLSANAAEKSPTSCVAPLPGTPAASSAAAAASSAASLPAAAEVPAAAGALSNAICPAGSPAAAAAVGLIKQEQQQELLFRDVCRLCCISEVISDGADAAASSPAASSLSSSSSCLTNSSSSNEERKTGRGAETCGEVSERGFSSGEVQRLGIARAIVKQPAVLLLDEATAHLDRRNEQLLLTTLRRLVSVEKKKREEKASRRSHTSRGEKSSTKGVCWRSSSSSNDDDDMKGVTDADGESCDRSSREGSPVLAAATQAGTPASETTSPNKEEQEAAAADTTSTGEEAAAAADPMGAAAAAGWTEKEEEKQSEQEGEQQSQEKQQSQEQQQQQQSSGSRLLEEGVKTIFLIAHSQAALKIADKVIVLRKGRLVEEGPYDLLLQQRHSELARLVQQQQQAEEKEEEDGRT